MTQPDLAILISIGSGVVSVGAFVLSLFRVRSARGANRLSASSAWATEVSKLIIAELDNTRVDDNLVRQLCTVPFKTQKAKKDYRNQLNALRDQSQHNVYSLDTLTDKRTKLQATKAARDKIDDSFWDNADLELPKERGDAKLAEYRVKAKLHIAELTNLMREVSTDGRLKLLAPAPAPRKKQKQLTAGDADDGR